MTSCGYRLSILEQSDTGRISATATVSADADWFSGHFPLRPILPGIAQLALIKEMVQKARGIPLELCGLKRVRFKKIIAPGQAFSLVVIPVNAGNNELSYSFRIEADCETACSGTIMFIEKPEQKVSGGKKEPLSCYGEK